MSRCGNFTLWRALSSDQVSFALNYFNWFTGTCATGALVACRGGDPCQGSVCDVAQAVCVPQLCNECRAMFWSGNQRVCMEDERRLHHSTHTPQNSGKMKLN